MATAKNVKVYDEEDLKPETRAKLGALVTKLQPAGITELLDDKLRKARLSWGNYRNDSEAALGELARRGLVVKPDLKLSKEYQEFRRAGGFFPSGENAHLQQNFSDAVRRFEEARLKAGPHQLIRLSPENNIFPIDNAMSHIKNDQILKTPRCNSIDDAVNFRIAAEAMAITMKTATVGCPFVAVDYQGVRYTERAYRVVQLSALFIGQLMDQLLPIHIDGVKLGEVRFYAPEKLMLQQGIAAIVSNIPSLSRPGRVHYASFENIPIVDRNNGDLYTIMATPEAIVLSYDLHVYQTTSEKEALFPVKFIRHEDSDGTDVRKGSEVWGSHSTIFGARRVKRTADVQLREGDDPGRAFVVLPMFPEIPPEAMREFAKFYGQKTSTGAIGGVIVEDVTRAIVGGVDREKITRRTLPHRLLDLDIALLNLVAFAGYDLTPRRPKVEYSHTGA